MAPPKIFKKCRWCDKEARRNRNHRGHSKGHYRTCGSKECMEANLTDEAVNKSKRCLVLRVCELCGEKHKANPNQKYCKKCLPTTNARHVYRRYGLTWPMYQELMNENKTCPICLKNPSRVVDHCHKTGRVRGFICDHCNQCLNLVENPEALKRALEYLKPHAV